MKNIGLIFPALLVVIGVYAFIVALGSESTQVALIPGYNLPRGLALMCGLLGLGGGTLVLFNSLSHRKRLS